MVSGTKRENADALEIILLDPFVVAVISCGFVFCFFTRHLERSGTTIGLLFSLVLSIIDDCVCSVLLYGRMHSHNNVINCRVKF